MLNIVYPGDPADLKLSRGDRFEIREARPGFTRTVKRQDLVDADSLTFDPGTATELELVLGGRGGPVHSPFAHLHHRALRAQTRTERPR